MARRFATGIAGRFAWIVSRESIRNKNKPISVTFERFARNSEWPQTCDSQFLAPKRDSQEKGSVREPWNDLRESGDSRESANRYTRIGPSKFYKKYIRAGKRGHYERGLFTGGISRISKISKFSRISRKWSDYPLFSTVWGFSKFSRISRKLAFLKRPLFQKTPFSEPDI